MRFYFQAALIWTQRIQEREQRGIHNQGLTLSVVQTGCSAAEGYAKLVFLERQWALPQLARHQFPGCLALNQNGELMLLGTGKPVSDGSSGITSSI
jgi:hypothetical protein